MANTNDTIDGLLAEFRGYSAGMPDSYHVTMSWADFRRMLDRFDAAHKREVQNALDAGGFVEASRKNKQVGDAAKLREVLKRIVAASIVAKNANAPEWILQRMADIFAMATTALAAPPRNCDRFATADEALKAQEQMFNDSNFANGECKLGCPECDNPRVGCKIAWLFAPATEKEGGDK